MKPLDNDWDIGAIVKDLQTVAGMKAQADLFKERLARLSNTISIY